MTRPALAAVLLLIVILVALGIVFPPHAASDQPVAATAVPSTAFVQLSVVLPTPSDARASVAPRSAGPLSGQAIPALRQPSSPATRPIVAGPVAAASCRSRAPTGRESGRNGAARDGTLRCHRQTRRPVAVPSPVLPPGGRASATACTPRCRATSPGRTSRSRVCAGGTLRRGDAGHHELPVLRRHAGRADRRPLARCAARPRAGPGDGLYPVSVERMP